MNTTAVRIVSGTLLATSTVASGIFAMPTDAPVDRLVRNASAYVEENPDDAYGHYVLGRIHALAFAVASSHIPVFREDSDRSGRPLPVLGSEEDAEWRSRRSNSPAVTPGREELQAHLEAAVREYQRTLELAPNQPPSDDSRWWAVWEGSSALYNLSLAWVLESGATIAGDADILPDAVAAPTDPEVRAEIEALIERMGDPSDAKRNAAMDALRERLSEAAPVLFEYRKDEDARIRDSIRDLLSLYWTERAIAHYLVAWRLSNEADAGVKTLPMRGVDELMSYEAGKSYLKLVRARGVRDEAESDQLEAVEQGLAQLEAKPPSGGITPIIFSLDAPRPLRDLLSGGQTACFDLDGDGTAEHWPWVRPGTAILVWDPEGRGAITSGRQLFGSVTWWLLPGDGYRALDLLDDNRDGELAGAELPGLALWFDGDSDGVSDPGEVVPITEAGVVALSTQATSMEDGCLANHTGIELADGRVLPTYDWVAQRMHEPSEDRSIDQGSGPRARR